MWFIRRLIAFTLGIGLGYTAHFAWGHERYNPPPQYDHPYRGKLTILRMSQETLQRRCRASISVPVKACTTFTRGRCTISLGPLADEGTLRHETAHCNGWTHPYP